MVYILICIKINYFKLYINYKMNNKKKKKKKKVNKKKKKKKIV